MCKITHPQRGVGYMRTLLPPLWQEPGPTRQAAEAIMSSIKPVEQWDEEEHVGDELAALHKAYLSSIRPHRALMGDLCQTLSHLADAIDASGLDVSSRTAIADGIGRHVGQARAIVADIELALTRAAVARPAARH